MLQLGIMAIMLALTINSTTSHVATVHQEYIPDKSKMASIIIDDFGNNMKGTQEIIAMPYPLTVAVMPFLPTSKSDAEAAHLAGKEVIIHMPMEPVSGNKSWLGPGVILTSLSDDEIRKRVDAAVAEIPHAIGINNHMGSKATGDPRVMRIVLEQCKKHRLFFVDSHTNYHSIACKTAVEVGVPCIENELFLDDTHTVSHVMKQIGVIHQRLQTRKYCVAIGHVGSSGRTTAEALKNKLPDLANYVQLIPISQLISLKHDGLTE
ncbi:divergent polysaccharide deacetylase family protein [Paenibacillus albiflavus]|uniref:Divergent polysaccharide deacetylase family protein n=1 Tax=Paenibacillus albiflavus TaxID=2545760 RepID=A0A4R4EGN6_9BACL|nr:divergent polysaccharide deacetylase family protein [Paenibacillus albiflavus]TCZ77421.1 divergent polysaccharide deacetylase family protein [Paenibacillus albiflavus]